VDALQAQEVGSSPATTTNQPLTPRPIGLRCRAMLCCAGELPTSWARTMPGIRKILLQRCQFGNNQYQKDGTRVEWGGWIRPRWNFLEVGGWVAGWLGGWARSKAGAASSSLT